jgi:hypothetical protein
VLLREKSYVKYAVQCRKKEFWGIRNNQDLYRQRGCEEWTIVKYPEESRTLLEGIRRVDRPKLWWMDGVVQDVRKEGIPIRTVVRRLR